MLILWLLLLLSVALLVVLALQWINYRQVQLQLDDFQDSVDGFVREAIEQQVTLEQMMQAATTSVEDVHRAFSDVSFDILESIPRTQAVGKRMRQLHNQSASGVYGTVRSVGKGLGVLRSEFGSKRKQRLEQGEAEDEQPRPKKR